MHSKISLNLFYKIITGVLFFIFFSNFVFAGNLSIDKNETHIGDTVVITGTGFSPSTTLVLQNNLEPNTAWWDGYNEQWGFPRLVTTNADGNFTFNWTVPYDFRLSPGKQYFSVANNISATMYWNAGGDYATSKNKIFCDGTSCYVISTSTTTTGGIEKFNMSTGARDCNVNIGVAITGNGIATDGTFIYTTYAATSNNLRRTLMSNCTGTTAFTTAAANAQTIAISSGFAFIGYAASTAPRKYQNLTTTPSLVSAFAPTARASIANDICISPDNTRVFVAYADGNILAYDYTTGATLWNSDPDDSVTQSANGIACDNSRVFVAKGLNNTVLGPFFGGYAFALDSATGVLVWRSQRIDDHYVYGQYNKIMCDSVNCYIAVQSPTLGGAGINGGPIIQIKKSDGTIGWVNWRSWLPASTAAYGTGSVQASPIDLWVDSEENGYIYPVYSTGRIQKLAKNDVSVETFYDTNLWIRSNPNLYHFVMNPTKNVFYSNETPKFTFKVADSNGQYLNTDDNRFNTSYLRFGIINAYKEFTATETASSQLMDPRIMTTYSTAATLPNPTPFNNLKFMFDEFDSGIFCQTATYPDKLFGWHINNRYCLYENMPVSTNLLHTQNGVKLASIANYFLVNPKSWSDYPITKTYGEDKWAWISSHNPTNNQILGYATRFGKNNNLWSNQLGQSTVFANDAAKNSIQDFFDASIDSWNESYFLTKPLGAGTDGNRHWNYIDEDTKKIAHPIIVSQGQNQSGSFVIGTNIYSNRIDFIATEPGIISRTNEPFWFDVNFTNGIKSNCSDLIVTDHTNTPIGLFQLDSEVCAPDNNYTLFIQDNFSLSQTKQYRLYYNSLTAAISPTGQTDLIVTFVSGTCGAGTDIIDINSTNWYKWSQPGVGATASNQFAFNFGGYAATWFNHATTRYSLNIGYLNSQSTGTGLGLTTNTTGAAQATFASRCYQRSYNRDKIFTRIDMNTGNFTVSPHSPTPGNPNATSPQTRIIMTRWYFFNNTGRIRMMSKLNSPLPIMTTGISQNYPPYYFIAVFALIPQGTATVANNNYVDWSGRKELMDAFIPAVYSPDKKTATLTASPLPLQFTIDYNNTFSNVSSAIGKTGKGCTVHKVWPYFSWRPNSPTDTTNAATFATAYTTDFISCDSNLSSVIPDVGNLGYVNAFPKESIYRTAHNRYVDPNAIAKFYLKPNLYIPDNRENRWMPPLSLSSQYNTTAKLSTFILDVCPTEEYGYKGYDDFLMDLENLISNSSTRKVETSRNNIPCATSVVIFSTSVGSIGRYLLFQRDVNVVVAENAKPERPYPSNLYINNILNINGVLDYTETQRGAQFYGKWFFTSSSDPMVISGYATTGAEQLSGFTRYAWAPSFAYNKKAYSETKIWNKEDSNLTYLQSPCNWNIGANPFGDLDLGPGWIKNFSTTQQGTICPRREDNKEQYSSFRPSVASLYPTSGSLSTAIENVIDGRPNKVTTLPDLGIDAALYTRHNSLWDYKHYTDYTQIIDSHDQLNEGTKHKNIQPWQCDFSRFDSRSFCLVPATTSTLIFTFFAGALTASQPWSAYYQSNREYNRLRNYLHNVWFNTAAMQPTNDFMTEILINPMLSGSEFTFDTLYTSNNPDDYNQLMSRVFPRLQDALYQNQFLLRDWKNTAFMILSGGDSREYLRGNTIRVNGFMMKNSDNLANAPIIVQVFKNSAPTVPLTTFQTTTDANGNFIYDYNIPTTAQAGLYFFKATYNNGEITGTTSFKISSLAINLSLNQTAFVAGNQVIVNATVTDAIIGSLITNAILSLRLIGPSGNVLLTTPMTNNNNGTYTHNFILDSNTTNGTYVLEIIAMTSNNTGTIIGSFVVSSAVSEILITNNHSFSDANTTTITQNITLQNVIANNLSNYIVSAEVSEGIDRTQPVTVLLNNSLLTSTTNYLDLNSSNYLIHTNSQNKPIIYIKQNFVTNESKALKIVGTNKYFKDIQTDYNSANNYSSELAGYCLVLLAPASQSDCNYANSYLTSINSYYSQAQTATTAGRYYDLKILTQNTLQQYLIRLNSLRSIATNQARCQIFVPGTWSLNSTVSLTALMIGPSNTPVTSLSPIVKLYDYDHNLLNNYNLTEFGGGWYYKSFTAPSTGGGYNLKIDQNIGTNRFLCAASFDVNQATSSVIGGGGGGLTTDQNQTLYMIYFLALDINSMINSINGTVNTINSTVNNINSTVNTINTNVNVINTIVSSIDSNVNYIKTNMATSANISALNTNIQSILNYSMEINSQVHSSSNTLSQLQASLLDINSTINSIRTTAIDINRTINTCESSPQASICGKLNGLTTNLSDMNAVLNNINSTTQTINSTNNIISQNIIDLNNVTNNIYSTVTTINSTSNLLNSKLSLIDGNIQSLKTNISSLEDLLSCSTSPENSVCDRLINLNIVVSNINQAIIDQNALLQQILAINQDINQNISTINTTLSTMNNTLNTINSNVASINLTILNIDSNVSYIKGNMASTGDIASLDSTLQSILNYSQDINSTVTSSEAQLHLISSTLTNIDNNVNYINTATSNIQEIINTCSSAPAGGVCNQLASLYNDLQDMNNTLLGMSSTINNIDSTTLTITQTVNDLNDTAGNIYSTVTDINTTSKFILAKVTGIETDTQTIQTEILNIQTSLNCANNSLQHSVCNNLSNISSLISDVNVGTQLSLLGITNFLSTLEYNQGSIQLSLSGIISDLNNLSCADENVLPLCANINEITLLINSLFSSINSLDSGIVDLNATMNQVSNTINNIDSTTTASLTSLTDLTKNVNYLATDVTQIKSEILTTQTMVTATNNNLVNLLNNLSQNLTDVNLSNNLSLLNILTSLSTIQSNQLTIDGNLSLIYNNLNCAGNPDSNICISLQTIIGSTNNLGASVLDLNQAMNVIGNNVLDINSISTNTFLTISDLNNSTSTITSSIQGINTNLTTTSNNIKTINQRLTDINSKVTDINKTVTDTNTTIGQTNNAVSNISSSVSSISGGIIDINNTLKDINASQSSISAALLQMQALLADINDTTNNIYINELSKFTVVLSDFDRLAPGSIYRAKLWAFDHNGSPRNADAVPTITLYDPSRNLVVNNVPMTLSETGIYTYNFTSTTGQIAGVWEAIATTTVKGVTTKPSDFWELTGNPPEVKIIAMTDVTVPTITANVLITNEGTTTQEYQYEYCIVFDQTNQCGGNDDIDYSSGAKLISPGQSWTTNLTLLTQNVGTYWFKVKVYYGIEMSAASKMFVAINQDTNQGGGGSGGGGGSASGGSSGGITGFINMPIDGGQISLFEYPSEMVVKQGDIEFYVLKIKNTGDDVLKDLEITLRNIPKEWYTIEIDKTNLLPYEEANVIIKLRIPEDAKIGDTLISFIIKTKGGLVSVDSVSRILEKSLAEIKFDDIRVSKLYINSSGEIECILQNTSNDEQNISVSLLAPKDWSIDIDEYKFTFKKGETKKIIFKVMTSYRSGVQNLVLVVKNNKGTNFSGTTEDKLYKEILVVVNTRENTRGFIMYHPTNIYIGASVVILVLFIVGYVAGSRRRKKYKPLGYNNSIFDRIVGLR